MATISGVKITKDRKGKTTHVAIDVRKHPEVMAVLKEKGLIPKTPLQIEAESCITVEELRADIHQLITDHYAKRSH